jgi:hypothetical protein
MKRGDVILLEEMDEEFQDGWWLGEHPGTGQKGLFPAGMSNANIGASRTATSWGRGSRTLTSSCRFYQKSACPRGPYQL